MKTDLVANIPLEYRSRTKPCRSGLPPRRATKIFTELSEEDQQFLNELVRLSLLEKADLNEKGLKFVVDIYRESLVKAGADPDNLDVPPDPRLSTPQKTLETLLEAIKNDDLTTALICFDPTGARVFNSQYKARGHDVTWNYMKDLLPVVEVKTFDAMAEYHSVNGPAAKIIFVLVFGNWRIAQF